MDEANGIELAKQYCQSCHLYPTPDLLNKATWDSYVLPRMGAFMGIYEPGFERPTLLEDGVGAKVIEAANIYPKTPTISTEEWEAIKAFYLDQAPEELKRAVSTPIATDTSLFKIIFPDLFLSPPSSTYVRLGVNEIVFADANKKMLFRTDRSFNSPQTAKIGEGLVHMHEEDDHFLLTMMGSFSPTGVAKGYLLKLPKKAGDKARVLIDQLQRPVHSTFGDLDGDQRMDIIISEFGKWTGGLTICLQQPDGSFNKRKIIKRSGAIKSAIVDANQDGLPDIIALFGQGEEGFVLLENQGGGKFTSRHLLRFSPSMGSSSFRLFDWNQDGKQDIIYTAGDNADYPPVVKPYHGVYIFEQGDDFSFRQSKFLALPGAYGAVPGDFDLDGNLDIAAISFFPDYESKKPIAFCFYENEGGEFLSRRVDLKNSGRWLTLDAGDLDQDGDLDLVLGNLSFEAPGQDTLLQQWIKKGLPFIIMDNQTN